MKLVSNSYGLNVLNGRLLQEFHWICLLTETSLDTLCFKNYLLNVIYTFVM